MSKSKKFNKFWMMCIPFYYQEKLQDERKPNSVPCLERRPRRGGLRPWSWTRSSPSRWQGRRGGRPRAGSLSPSSIGLLTLSRAGVWWAKQTKSQSSRSSILQAWNLEVRILKLVKRDHGFYYHWIIDKLFNKQFYREGSSFGEQLVSKLWLPNSWYSLDRSSLKKNLPSQWFQSKSLNDFEDVVTGRRIVAGTGQLCGPVDGAQAVAAIAGWHLAADCKRSSLKWKRKKYF